MAFDPSSFKDPDGRLFALPNAMGRTVAPHRVAPARALFAEPGFQDLIAKRMVPPTAWAKPTEYASVAVPTDGEFLVQEKIPFVAYPAEWSFSMLRDAALVTLAIMRQALGWNAALKDATPYNVVFHGTEARFVDIHSFESYEGRGGWIAYGQFCRAFLLPLMIASHRGVPLAMLHRGADPEIRPDVARAFFRWTDIWRRGVFREVFLSRWLESLAKSAIENNASMAASLRQAAVPAARIRETVDRLEAQVRALRRPGQGSHWEDYATNHSYDARDEEAKEAFVRRAMAAAAPRRVVDLGANTGHYSRIAADFAQEAVIAVEADEVAADRLYNALGRQTKIYPVVADVAQPTPGVGWAGRERLGLLERLDTDAFLALAVIHHLRISANVPFAMIVAQLAALGRKGVVEWVEPEDPMVKRMMTLRRVVHDDFSLPTFRHLLAKHFRVIEEESVKGGLRTLFFVERL